MIFFNVKKARECLIKNGTVYTLRRNKRRTGFDLAVQGSYYKHQKIGRVFISYVGQIRKPEELIPYVKLSGFDTFYEWFTTAKSLHKQSKFMYLYKVTLLKSLEKRR